MRNQVPDWLQVLVRTQRLYAVAGAQAKHMHWKRVRTERTKQQIEVDAQYFWIHLPVSLL